MTRFVGWRDQLLGASIGAAYVLVLVASSHLVGPARDEGFYSVSADRYAGWIVRSIGGSGEALDPASIDRAWSVNHEHPPLAKTLFGLSALAMRALAPGARASLGYRLPAIAAAGLLLWLTYVLGARTGRRRVGVFAALALAVIPRVFHHAGLACLDVPIVLLLVATTYAYWRSLERRRWALVAGVLYGLALLTKHNAWFLPPVLLLHWLTIRLAAADERPPAARRWPLGVLAMLAIGPAMLVGGWPWLWHDTVARLREYVLFHVEHVSYPIEYLGTTWFEAPFPAHYAVGSLLATVPTTLVALAVLGVVQRRATLAPPWLERWVRRQRGRGTDAPPRRTTTERIGRGADPRHTELLLLLSALWPIALLSTTRAPIFGGTKHFLAAYPYLTIFAGVGYLSVARAARSAWSWWRGPATMRWRDVRRRGLELVVGALLLAPAVAQTAHAHPFALSSYVPLLGGAPGGAELGMNRQYWGQATRQVASIIRQELPRGGTVFPGDTAIAAWRLLLLDGSLPRNVLATPDLAHADLVLVHHEPHMLTVDAQAWVAHGSAVPIEVLDLDGVPLVSVYANPRGRARSALRRRRAEARRTR